MQVSVKRKEKFCLWHLVVWLICYNYLVMVSLSLYFRLVYRFGFVTSHILYVLLLTKNENIYKTIISELSQVI